MPLASDQLEIRPGKPWPLGATPLPDGRGVNFSVFSQHGDAVDLILFDREAPDREAARVRVTGRTGHLRHVEVRGVEAGQVYGYRVHGPWMPEWGLLFNPDKLLLDPYARRVLGPSAAHPAMIGKSEHGRDRRDSVAVAPKGVVVDSSGFDWGDDRPPEVPPDQSVVYELHVKGFTRQMPGVPEDLRGTYAGLGSDAAIAYLKALGITAVQLMPVHQHLDDGFLVDRGLVNYWGYNTIGFFAPEARYAATGDPVTEFKSMVRALHAAGIEVILDVVFNHTGEAGPDGPLCLLRGFENLGYYRTNLKRPEDYTDVTGCGNTVDLTHPMGLRLVIDSLRYWVEEMRVDGFRFDLAVTLGREPSSFNPQSAFFKAVQLDPVLAGVKLVAEPWDLGRGGYQVGAFPPGWHELNGRFRDCVRRFWRGEGGVLAEFASRITGSEDLFRHNGRTPLAGVNFFASHDGFTLRDLVSYADKHNEANGEGNRDGDNHNLSANYGIEGPTHDPALEDLRSRQCRNFFATLMLSQGVPFILAGDEIGRTQRGNNNAYCQDNEISWIDWENAGAHEPLRRFVTRLVAFRRQHAVLRRGQFFSGMPIHGAEGRDMAWFDPSGGLIGPEGWHAGEPGAFAVVINRNASDLRDNGWRHHPSDSLLLVFNAHSEPLKFRLPGAPEVVWEAAFDTAAEAEAEAEAEDFFFPPGARRRRSGDEIRLHDRSVQAWLLRGGHFLCDQTPGPVPE